MDRPLHILHLTIGADAGGLSRYIIDLCVAMRALGHRCTVAGDSGAWDWAFRDAGVDYVTIPLKRGLTGFRGSLRTLRPWLARQTEQPVDVLHTHYRRATLLGRRLQSHTASGRRTPPLLYTLHLSHIAIGWFRSWLTDFGDHTHAASLDAVDWLRDDARVPASQIHYVPHGVDVAKFAPPDPAARAAARARLGVNDGEVMAMYVGRLDWPKNEEWLLDVDEQLHRRGVKAKLFFVGEGPHEAMLKTRIAAEGSTGRVFVVGHQDPKPFYHAADALLLPSQREGFSFVCAEAMACGVPCLRTRTSGTRELIVENTTGLSVPIEKDAFVSGATAFLSDRPALGSMGTAARRHVEQFSFARQLERTLALYRQLVA